MKCLDRILSNQSTDALFKGGLKSGISQNSISYLAIFVAKDVLIRMIGF